MDPCEDILERIAAILQGLPGYLTTGRNLKGLPDTSLPAAAVLDGSEEAHPDDPARTSLMPRRIVMRPEIFVSLPEATENAGPELSRRRGEIIKAVCGDAQLAALTINRTGARYEGRATALSSEGGMLADMSMRFRLLYWLDPRTIGDSA